MARKIIGINVCYYLIKNQYFLYIMMTKRDTENE